MGFGVHLPVHGRYSYVDAENAAVLADRLGYASLWVGDHFFLPSQSYSRIGGDPSRPDKLEAWPVLAALAARTQRITLGTRVSPIPFYLPGRLAKTVATVDVISNGRVVLGAGAGWHRGEAVSFGLDWHPLRTRIKQMLEGLEIIRRLWTEDRTTFRGMYFRIYDAPCYPKPVQKPSPPIMFGGNAERILDTVGKTGRGWLPNTNMTTGDLKSRMARIWASAEEAGRGRDTIIVAASLSHPEGTGDRPIDWESKVREFAALGVSQMILDLSQMDLPPDDGLSLLERFSTHVIDAYV